MNGHPLLYEINTVFWLDELSRNCGEQITLGRVPKEKRKTSPVQLRREQQEDVELAISTFYRKLLCITKHEAFHNGVWELIEVLPGGDIEETPFITYTCGRKDRVKLVVVNLG